MDFDLSEQQRALRDAARELLDSAASRERVRAVIDAPDGYDAGLWAAMGEQGWLALELPEVEGGLALTFVEVAVLCEEVGRHVAPAPFLSNTLALAGITRAIADSEISERLQTGAAVGCVGFGGEVVVDAPIADVALLVTADEVRMVTLEPRPDAQPAMDVTRRVAWVEGGEPIAGAALADELLDRGAVAYAAEILGAAERMLEVSVDYAKVREQFGRPIGSFQAVKHRLADMLVDVEGIRSATWYAAWAVANEAPDRALAASTAKAWASEAGPRVIDGALQVHGGIGFTWEHDLHLYLKRVHLDARQFGDATLHHDRIVRGLRARLADGVELF